MKKQMLSACAAAGMLLAGAPAVAEVKASAPDGMRLEYSAEAPVGTGEMWNRVLAVGSWWSHSYSGDVKNMRLDAKAGGCWCEVWPGGSVEHGRVLTAMKFSMLRINAPLGPLQATGANAVLSIEMGKGKDQYSTSVKMTMNVVGSSLSDLDKIAVPVDAVLGEAFGKLVAGK